MKSLIKVLGLCWCFSAASAGATCLTSDRLTGLNIAGAEFGSLPGRLNYEYIYPERQELEKLAEFGGNFVRLPVRWERLRPTAGGALQASEMQQITAVYEAAKALGLCVLIDMHNYAQYYDQSIASNQVLKSSFTDTWLKLAAAFPDIRHIALGLMNEPVYMPVKEWAQLAQNTLQQLRRQKRGHLIVVAGGRWSGAHDWFAGTGQDINASAFATFSDPLDNYAIEVHQYADHDSSGMHDVCREAAAFEGIFARISEWATTYGHRLLLGEFGVAGNAVCLNTLDAFLNLTKTGPWLGWSYWAAGRWWGNYSMAVSLRSMSDSPQWAVLHPFLVAERAAAAADNTTVDTSFENVVIGGDIVLKPDAKVGKNVKFVSAATIPDGLDLTLALRSMAWTDGDLRAVVDLSDDVLLPVQGSAPISLLGSIRLLDEYERAGAAVSQRNNGELAISADDYGSALLPVHVSMAGIDDQEGSRVNDDGDIVFVTANGRVIKAYPMLSNKAGFEAMLATLGLQLGYDQRANIIGQPRTGGAHYFSARPDVMILPATGAEGIRYDRVAGLPNAMLVSLVFKDPEGELMSQAVVPVPADWIPLKASLAAMPGISDVKIDARGVISVLRNGIRMKARSGFRVERGSPEFAQADRVVFQPVDDVNGDGQADFMVIYPNGDQQLLLIYPPLD